FVASSTCVFTLSLHDALPICSQSRNGSASSRYWTAGRNCMPAEQRPGRLLIAASIPEMVEVFLLPYARHMRSLGWRVDVLANGADRKSTRLNSSHVNRSYSVF